MAENKTTWTDKDVTEFVNSVDNEVKRRESFELIDIFRSISGFEPTMWGPSIIGFGKYHYKYDSGHEGDAPLTGFSPRKDSIALYLAPDMEKREKMLAGLGKHKSGKSCVYVKKLADIDKDVLREMIADSIAHINRLYPDRPA